MGIGEMLLVSGKSLLVIWRVFITGSRTATEPTPPFSFLRWLPGNSELWFLCHWSSNPRSRYCRDDVLPFPTSLVGSYSFVWVFLNGVSILLHLGVYVKPGIFWKETGCPCWTDECPPSLLPGDSSAPCPWAFSLLEVPMHFLRCLQGVPSTPLTILSAF